MKYLTCFLVLCLLLTGCGNGAAPTETIAPDSLKLLAVETLDGDLEG